VGGAVFQCECRSTGCADSVEILEETKGRYWGETEEGKEEKVQGTQL